jgi:tRNA1Val (adenine37-N6)-methyltransferase
MSNGFTFKRFRVRHDRCAMKVGTDGVLVGAWARGGRRMLDIGSGTGLIALMLAQRFDEAWVDGLEVDAEAVAQSRENIAASPFADRIAIHQTAFQYFRPQTPYDAIVSNPPFFLNGLKNPDDGRTRARHSDPMFFKSFFRFSKQWLADSGEVSLVIPSEHYEDVSAEAYLLGFLLSRRVWVRSSPRKPVERCLLAFAKRRTGMPEEREVCLMENGGEISTWYKEITCEFYL